jgi:acetyltransferase-like isoleucine patch superfamily enzyme
MRGRTLFTLTKPLLLVLAAVFALLPRGIARLLLTLARPVPTRIGIALRYALLRRLARRCGNCVAIHEHVFLFRLEHAEFGDNVSVHPMCYLDATGGLTIGNDVSIAHGATLLTTEHDYGRPGVAIRDAPVIEAPVGVGDDVWIGAGARILAGVRIADHAVVGAGAVVTRNVGTMQVVAGVPARALKPIARRSGTV